MRLAAILNSFLKNLQAEFKGPNIEITQTFI